MTDLIPYAGIVWPVLMDVQTVVRGDQATDEEFVAGVELSRTTAPKWDEDSLTQIFANFCDEGIEYFPQAAWPTKVPRKGEPVEEHTATFIWNVVCESVAELADEVHQADLLAAAEDYCEDYEEDVA